MNFKKELQSLTANHQWKKAYSLVEKIDLSDSTDPEFLYLAGLSYEKNHYIQQALTLLSKAYSHEPKNLKYAKALTEVALIGSQPLLATDALTYLEQAEPDALTTLRFKAHWLKLKQEDPAIRRDLLKKITRESYEESEAMELAELYLHLGDEKKGKTECRRIIHYFRRGPVVDKASQLLEDLKKETEKPSTPPQSSPQKMVRPAPTKGSPHKTSPKPTPLPPEIEKEFASLIGMDSVKQQFISFVNEAKLDQKRGLSSKDNHLQDRSYHFMLVGNPGTGKTTVARIIAKVLHQLNIRSADTLVEVDKSNLVGQHIGETEKNTRQYIQQASQGTLFVDEAYTLYSKDNPKDFGREALNVLMKSMEDKRDTMTVVLAGYEKQMKEMLNANPGLASRIDFTIRVPDYSDEELLQIADEIAQKRMLLLTASGKKALLHRIQQERIDDKFGNARFIRSTLNEAYRTLANRLSQSNHSQDDMYKLTAEDFGVDLQLSPEEEISQALEELNQLTGLESVKKNVKETVNNLRVRKEMIRRGLLKESGSSETLHMVFSGNPGTGKTTVARIIGRIYKSLGVLKRGDVFQECTRADLVGRYQGHTAEKTKTLISDSLGGILFIDEAYGLYQGENDTFGKEAIDTLIAEMENKRDRLLVILAGYQEEMEALLEANPGFRSRISTSIVFEDYSLEQLKEIFLSMTHNQQLHLSAEAYPLLEQRLAESLASKDFGNARGVRNLLDQAIRSKNSRVSRLLDAGKEPKEYDFLRITPEDLKA